jgi:hypothetical protein
MRWFVVSLRSSSKGVEYAPAGHEALAGQLADGLAGVPCEVLDIGDRHQGMDGIDQRYCVAGGELRDA